MFRKLFIPIISFFGACIALAVVIWGQKTPPVPPILYPPAISPYPLAIAGAGIVEASSENISVGSPFSEIVTHIAVTEGDKVKAGDVLFTLDLRQLRAEEATSKASLEEGIIHLENIRTQFSFYERLSDKKAVSEKEYQQIRYALKEAEQQVEVAKARLVEVETKIERSIICSPVDGEILQVNVHIGEIAPVVPFVSSQATLILLGTVHPLQLRVDIDEDDAWRFKKGTPGTAFVRGNSQFHFPIRYIRTEPYMTPKGSFTGDTTEKIDTRVLQVLYQFEKGDLPIYVGQVMDVFIEVPKE